MSVSCEADLKSQRPVATPYNILHCMRAPVGGLFRHVLDLAAELGLERLSHAHPYYRLQDGELGLCSSQNRLKSPPVLC